MTPTIYSAPCKMDAANRWTTILVTLLLLAMVPTIVGTAAIFDIPRAAFWALVGSALLGPLVLAICGLYAPRSIDVTAEAVLVRRIVPPARIPLSEIRSVERIGKMSGLTLRTCGVGGFMGNYGYFWNKSLGSFRLYATRSSDFVVLHTGGKPVVVTPGESEAFVRALEPLLQRG